MYDFKDDFKTNIEFVDEQHKRLFQIADEIYLLLTDEFLVDKYDKIVDLINELHDYTVFHFTAEEKYMTSINYIGLPEQKRQHKLFVDKLANVNLNDVDDKQDEYIKELLSFVNTWLIEHIYQKDKLIPNHQ